jgi:hypothetical protein
MWMLICDWGHSPTQASFRVKPGKCQTEHLAGTSVSSCDGWAGPLWSQDLNLTCWPLWSWPELAGLVYFLEASPVLACLGAIGLGELAARGWVWDILDSPRLDRLGPMGAILVLPDLVGRPPGQPLCWPVWGTLVASCLSHFSLLSFWPCHPTPFSLCYSSNNLSVLICILCKNFKKNVENRIRIVKLTQTLIWTLLNLFPSNNHVIIIKW